MIVDFSMGTLKINTLFKSNRHYLKFNQIKKVIRHKNYFKITFKDKSYFPLRFITTTKGAKQISLINNEVTTNENRHTNSTRK